MITLKDIEFLKEIFPTREEMNQRFEEMDRKFDNLLTAIDKVLKELLDFRQEMTILSHNQTTIKEWMKPVSKKTGVDYPF